VGSFAFARAALGVMANIDIFTVRDICNGFSTSNLTWICSVHKIDLRGEGPIPLRFEEIVSGLIPEQCRYRWTGLRNFSGVAFNLGSVQRTHLTSPFLGCSRKITDCIIICQTTESWQVEN
jgi:hypothetical protein